MTSFNKDYDDNDDADDDVSRDCCTRYMYTRDFVESCCVVDYRILFYLSEISMIVSLLARAFLLGVCVVLSAG